MVSEPLSDDDLAKVARPGGEGFEDKRNLGTIGRLTKDDRLLWAGRSPVYHFKSNMHERHRHNEKVFGELQNAYREWFPMWQHIPFTHAYGGPVGLTTRLEPYVGKLRGDIYYAYGYSGQGVGPSPVVAKSLRDLILGRDSAYTNLLFVNQREANLPPEPLRFVGARLTTKLLAHQDRRMDAGHVIKRDLAILRLLHKLR
jgi:glycine/D-amino acid oxidase-like deaminating enzyme